MAIQLFFSGQCMEPDVLEEMIYGLNKPEDCISFARVNSTLCREVPNCISLRIVQKICKLRFPVMDTGDGQLPGSLLFRVIKQWWRKSHIIDGLLPRISSDAGVSVVVMRQGLSLNSMRQVAKDAGITVSIDSAKKRIDPEFLPELEKTPDVCLKNTCVIAISNAALRGGTHMNFEQHEEFVWRLACKIPSIWGYFSLCTLAKKNGYGFPYDRLLNIKECELTLKDDWAATVRSSTLLGTFTQWSMEAEEAPHKVLGVTPEQIQIGLVHERSRSSRTLGVGACLELFSLPPESTHL
jgi:hypothetical protein